MKKKNKKERKSIRKLDISTGKLRFDDKFGYSLFTSMFDSIDQSVYITDPNSYKIIFINKSLKDKLGNAVGKKCYRVLQNLNSPCSFCTNDRIFGKNLGKTYIWELQNRVNNRWYHCIDRAIRWVDGKMVRCEMAIDITDKKIGEQILKESEERFKGLTEQSPNMIFINCKGKVVYVNKECERLTGYTREKFYSPRFDFFKLIAPEYVNVVKSYFKKHMNGKEVAPYEYAVITKTGERIEAILNTKLIKYNGEDAILGIITDITRRKQTEQSLKKTVDKLQRVVSESVQALATASEKRDPYVAGHQYRVAKLSMAIGKEMNLPKEQIEGIYVAASLHDIGKINIPSEYLAKPSELTETEFMLIKDHVRSSHDILKVIEFPWPVSQVILQHHERVNGTGYPYGLKGKSILLEAKIIGVADVVEAMSYHRPYREALGIKKALDEISHNKNILYDGKVVNTCVRLFKNRKFKFD